MEGLSLGMMIILLVIGGVIGAIFFSVGAALAGIENRSFGKAFLTVVVGWFVATVVSGFVTAVLALSGPVSLLIGAITWFVVLALVAKGFYGTTFGKALVAALVSWFVSWATILVLAAVL